MEALCKNNLLWWMLTLLDPKHSFGSCGNHVLLESAPHRLFESITFTWKKQSSIKTEFSSKTHCAHCAKRKKGLLWWNIFMQASPIGSFATDFQVLQDVLTFYLLEKSQDKILTSSDSKMWQIILHCLFPSWEAWDASTLSWELDCSIYLRAIRTTIFPISAV